MYLKKIELGTFSGFYIFCSDCYGWWQCTVVIVVMPTSRSLEKVMSRRQFVYVSYQTVGQWLQDLKELLAVRYTSWNRITSSGPLWGIWSAWHWGHVKISAGRKLPAELSTQVTSGQIKMPQTYEQHLAVWYVTQVFLCIY